MRGHIGARIVAHTTQHLHNKIQQVLGVVLVDQQRGFGFVSFIHVGWIRSMHTRSLFAINTSANTRLRSQQRRLMVSNGSLFAQWNGRARTNDSGWPFVCVCVQCVFSYTNIGGVMFRNGTHRL